MCIPLTEIGQKQTYNSLVIDSVTDNIFVNNNIHKHISHTIYMRLYWVRDRIIRVQL